MNEFNALRVVLEGEFFGHRVVKANPYTTWFKTGEASHEQVVDLITQFSVFSNHFLIAQTKRMVFAETEEGERCARNILMSECGVALEPGSGSPEGRSFSTANAHLNWLREVGAPLGLAPMDLGRWRLATNATKTFLRRLDRAYGSADESVGAGASFAIETWAAFGIGQGKDLESHNFWHELITGLRGHNAARVADGRPPLPLGFFEWHFAVESGHGANVWAELEESCRRPGFCATKFLKGGRQALDAIALFWDGLDAARRGQTARLSRPFLSNSEA